MCKKDSDRLSKCLIANKKTCLRLKVKVLSFKYKNYVSYITKIMKTLKFYILHKNCQNVFKFL